MRFVFVLLLGFTMTGNRLIAQSNDKGVRMGHFDGDAVMEVLMADNADYKEYLELEKAKEHQLELLVQELAIFKDDFNKNSSEMDEVQLKLRKEEIESKEGLVGEYKEIIKEELAGLKMKAVQPAKAKFTLAVRQAAEENEVNYIVDTSKNAVLFDLTGNGDDGKEGIEVSDDSIDLQEAILAKL